MRNISCQAIYTCTHKPFGICGNRCSGNYTADQRLCFHLTDSISLPLLIIQNFKFLTFCDWTGQIESPGCPVLLFFLFFPIFSGLPIFSYILIPNPIFFHRIPVFFKMLQIIMKYQGKSMEFWFEMPVLMSLAFIFFLARS